MRRQKRPATTCHGNLKLLDSSSLPVEQTDIARSFEIKVEPLNSLPPLNSPAPLTFDVPESTVFYTAASEIYLDISWRCLHADGTILAPNEQMSVICAPFHTMFRDAEIYINNRQVSYNTGHYPLLAYLNTLLFTNESTKQGTLSNILWKQDAAGSLDLYTPAGANDASDWRGEYIAQSRVVHMHGKLMCDTLSSPRLLPANTLLKVKLFPVPPSFLFMGAAAQNYAVEITNASLFVKRVELTPTAMTRKEQELQKRGFLYPILEHRIVEKNIAPNSQKMVATLFSNELLPSRLFLVFSRTQSLMGDNTMNPLNLMTTNLTSLSVSVNGVQLPHVLFTPNFTNGNYSRELMALSKNLKSDYKAVLTKEQFGGGYGIFVIDLQPISSDAHYRSRPFSGHVQVNAQWGQPLANGLTLLAIGLFNATLLLDGQRQVFIRSGKTTLLKNLLVHSQDVFDKPINRLIFVYGGGEQPLYDELRRAIPNNTFIQGWDEALLSNKAMYMTDNDAVQTALVIDDAIMECGNSAFLIDCFVKYRSRWKLNIILLSQVIFQPDLKGLRTISRNATGMFLMRNRRGRQSLKILASQMGIDDVKSFMKIFESATDKFGYLFCDMGGWLNEEVLRFRSGILPCEQSTCYEFIE